MINDARKLTLRLRRAMDNRDFDDFVLLIQKGGSVDSIYDDSINESLLHHASFCGYLDYATVLLNNAADTEIQDIEGETAIIAAARQGFSDIVELLIQYKANVNHRSRSGWNALDAANSVHQQLLKGIDIFQSGGDYPKTISLLAPHTTYSTS